MEARAQSSGLSRFNFSEKVLGTLSIGIEVRLRTKLDVSEEK
jgi:hypothetical protein